MVFQKGFKMKQEIKDKISNSMRGKPKPKEQSERLRKRNLENNPMNKIETREKMRQTKLRQFKEGIWKSPMLNKHHSIKTKKKISKTQKEFWKNRTLSKEEKRIRVNAQNSAKRHISLKPSYEICQSTNNLQKHHWRYDKPLMVNTLCKQCHEIQHSKFKGGII
jgi:hypothetical protein